VATQNEASVISKVISLYSQIPAYEANLLEFFTSTQLVNEYISPIRNTRAQFFHASTSTFLRASKEKPFSPSRAQIRKLGLKHLSGYRLRQLK
jgi:hypothetical protein